MKRQIGSIRSQASPSLFQASSAAIYRRNETWQPRELEEERSVRRGGRETKETGYRSSA